MSREHITDALAENPDPHRVRFLKELSALLLLLRQQVQDSENRLLLLIVGHSQNGAIPPDALPLMRRPIHNEMEMLAALLTNSVTSSLAATAERGAASVAAKSKRSVAALKVIGGAIISSLVLKAIRVGLEDEPIPEHIRRLVQGAESALMKRISRAALTDEAIGALKGGVSAVLRGTQKGGEQAPAAALLPNLEREIEYDSASLYADAQTEMAGQIGEKVLMRYTLSAAHPRFDECDHYEGELFEPEDATIIPLHRACLCFWTPELVKSD